jgi:hypothetical protein
MAKTTPKWSMSWTGPRCASRNLEVRLYGEPETGLPVRRFLRSKRNGKKAHKRNECVSPYIASGDDQEQGNVSDSDRPLRRAWYRLQSEV